MNIIATCSRQPWNKGKLVGQKTPLRLRDIWAIRVRLQIAERSRDLALFDLAIDSKLRACDLTKLRVRDVAHGEHVSARAIVMQQKTQRPVQFEITEQTRSALAAWINQAQLRSEDCLFPSRLHTSEHLSTRQYARIVKGWVKAIGLDPAIDVGLNGVVTLISGDARILVRRPFHEGDIGKDLSKGPLFTELLPKRPYGTATARSAVDGVDRIVGFRRVEDYPLITFVALDRYENLAAWRKETLLSLGLMFLLLSILGTLSYRLIRLMQQQNHVQRALFLAQEQLLENATKLQAQALEDGLTGLANRRFFDQYLTDEMGRARRERQKLALLMLDVDHFKRFNDEHGHLAGDECLRAVAEKIRQTIKRPGDMAFRYGGEEFAVVLPGADSQGAMVVAETIRKAIETAEFVGTQGTALRVTVSIGLVSIQPTPEDTPDLILSAADKALYSAKTSGRNRTVDAL